LLLLTTSRRPTELIRSLCRDFSNSIPDVVRINRGKMSLTGVAERAIEFKTNKVVLVDRWDNGVGKISFFTVDSSGLTSFPPLMFFSRVLLRREFKKLERSCSSVITMAPEDSPKLERLAECLSQFFNLPNLTLIEAAKSHHTSLHLSQVSLGHVQVTFMLLQQMVEIGPRVTFLKLVWEVPQ